jgi:hypothetical protein
MEKDGMTKEFTAHHLAQREAMEKAFTDIGFRSKKFSHAKEPETRRADSLLLILDANRRDHGRLASLEIRVQFYAESTVIMIAADAWSTRGCMPRRCHNDRLEQQYAGFNPSIVKAYVVALMEAYI